jgi:hypothetical protein
MLISRSVCHGPENTKRLINHPSDGTTLQPKEPSYGVHEFITVLIGLTA